MEPESCCGHDQVMDQASDAELWRAAASGSDAAFGALFERHASAVYNYCFRRRGDWAEAEDLTSAVFLEAWRRRDEVVLTTDSIRPWLFGVATNLLRNDIRSRRRRDAALARFAVVGEQAPIVMADEVADRLDDQRRMKALLRQLEGLPIEQQEVIALVLWCGLSYADAAVALGVREGTVKSRLSRARSALREPLELGGHDMDDSIALARASTPKPREVDG